MHSSTALLIWGIVAHLVADWLCQNAWQADNKANLKHPAAWVHGGIHLLALWLVFPFSAALFVALVHIWIDTRKPLTWWGDWIGQTKTGMLALHVAVWRDQVAHILVIAIAAYLVGVHH